VISPILIAIVIVLAGAAAMARELGDGLPKPRRRDVLAVAVGAGLCLFAFMANALSALPSDGLEAAYYARGGAFLWPVYAAGLLVGSAGLLRSVIRVPSG
jgi:hypothetical protein